MKKFFQFFKNFSWRFNWNRNGGWNKMSIFNKKKMHPDEALLERRITLLKINKNKEISGIHKNHEYYYKVQGQLHVTNRKYGIVEYWIKKMNEQIERDDYLIPIRIDLFLLYGMSYCLFCLSFYNKVIRTRSFIIHGRVLLCPFHVPSAWHVYVLFLCAGWKKSLFRVSNDRCVL